ncbi:hypothetical protein [Streptomyces sp. NBC_00118]|uniref:hypothetical protein n=1 Tax=unclassified Streptomyces TaxID=2593676 RepID=UPI00308C2960|nr:hypothetical protein OG518_38300 [Streptomyces sp. NBC_01397]
MGDGQVDGDRFDAGYVRGGQGGARDSGDLGRDGHAQGGGQVDDGRGGCGRGGFGDAGYNKRAYIYLGTVTLAALTIRLST